MSVPIALTIAGSDSSGGAGIQADLKTFSALGVYGASVICALTAQNTQGVRAIHPAPPAFVGEQLDAVFEDIAVGATKIGMLSSGPIVTVVAERLRAHRAANVVLDPVMVAKSGDRLLREDAVESLKRDLLPLATVLTPNLPEAADLLGEHEADVAKALPAAATRLRDLGPQAVLLKGGHLTTNHSNDVFVSAEGTVTLTADRIATRNTHGTGCTLSSAIAAYLARGASPLEAVRAAKNYIAGAIAAADSLAIGHGQGPVHHFYKFWEH